MLFGITYRRKPETTDNDARRLLQIFVAWEPPEGVEIKSHYAFASGGGMAIVETNDAGRLSLAFAPFAAHLDFRVEPVLSVPEALAIRLNVNDWADSVTGRGSQN